VARSAGGGRVSSSATMGSVPEQRGRRDREEEEPVLVIVVVVVVDVGVNACVKRTANWLEQSTCPTRLRTHSKTRTDKNIKHRQHERHARHHHDDNNKNKELKQGPGASHAQEAPVETPSLIDRRAPTAATTTTAGDACCHPLLLLLLPARLGRPRISSYLCFPDNHADSSQKKRCCYVHQRRSIQDPSSSDRVRRGAWARKETTGLRRDSQKRTAPLLLTCRVVVLFSFPQSNPALLQPLTLCFLPPRLFSLPRSSKSLVLSHAPCPPRLLPRPKTS